MKLEDLIAAVPDFPHPPILFRDITPLLASAAGLREAVLQMSERHRSAGVELVAGIETRGLILASAMAVELGAGLIPIRKPGKLPREHLTRDYQLEYGTATLELHSDAVRPGQKVLLVDDLLATGGTAAAALDLLRALRAEVVAACFLVELVGLDGATALAGLPVISEIRLPEA